MARSRWAECDVSSAGKQKQGKIIWEPSPTDPDHIPSFGQFESWFGKQGGRSFFKSCTQHHKQMLDTKFAINHFPKKCLVLDLCNDTKSRDFSLTATI